MWAFAPSVGSRGLNSYRIVVTDVTQHSSFTFLLCGLPHGKPEATFEADAVGQRRIGSANAAATKF